MSKAFSPESKVKFLAEAYALLSTLVLGFIKATYNSNYVDFSLTHTALIIEMVAAPLVWIVAFWIAKGSIQSVFHKARPAVYLFVVTSFLNLLALPVVLLAINASALDEFIWAMGIVIAFYYLVDRWNVQEAE